MSPFVQSVVHALGWTLLHFVWQGMVIALLLALLLYCMGVANARARYLVSYMALLTCIAVVVFEFYQHLGVTHISGEVEIEQIGEIPVRFILNASVWGSFSSWLELHLTNVVMTWLVCVILLAVRMCAGLWWIGTYTSPKRSKPDAWWQTRIDRLSEQFRIHRNVLFRVADDLSGPVTIGVFRPVILLPGAMLSGMPVELLEMLVAHELAHIKRHDYLLNLIQTVIEMLLFYHPAVWWISKQIRHDREEIADELAARVTGEPRRLALALSELANFQFPTPQLAQAAHGGNLMSRIKHLLQPQVQHTSFRGILGLLGIAASTAVYAGQALSPLAEPPVQQKAPGIILPPYISPIKPELVQTADAENLPKKEIKTALLQTKVKKAAEKPVVTKEDKDAPALAPVENNQTTESSPSAAEEDKPVVADVPKVDETIRPKAKISLDVSACYPKYPAYSLRAHETGATSLMFLVKKDGIIDEVKIITSSGSTTLDYAAAQAFQGCKIKPVIVDGAAVALRSKIKFVWKIS
ncbi:TonB family protein [Undibacterium sp. TJN19]|uniref:TonB family protein n=1 Tax=Undibacterium sp. TJN19 TaxID=3413055 RepID=UPI003BF13A81